MQKSKSGIVRCYATVHKLSSIQKNGIFEGIFYRNKATATVVSRNYVKVEERN